MRVPDLFRHESAEEALRLYEIAMAALAARPEERVELCRRVRRHASTRSHARLAASTRVHEVEALFVLREPHAAWRALRELEAQIAWHACAPWSRASALRASVLRPAVLYLGGRDVEAAELLEAKLAARLRLGGSFAALAGVMNDDAEPRSADRVTLAHVYARLGQRLTSWYGWPRFVLDLDERLLALAGIERGALLANDALLVELVAVLEEERKVRLVSGETRGEIDLIEDAASVRRWQEEQVAERDAFRRRTAARRAELAAKLRRYFPFVDR